MPAKFELEQKVIFANQESVVKEIAEENGKFKYYCVTGNAQLPMWIAEDSLETGNPSGPPTVFFNRRMPHMVVVDNFYKDPDDVREFALLQNFQSNLADYKGKRTTERFLWPFMKEEFERLLGRPISDWLNQPANGCFQITGYDDPLVWHADTLARPAAHCRASRSSANTRAVAFAPLCTPDARSSKKPPGTWPDHHEFCGQRARPR